MPAGRVVDPVVAPSRVVEHRPEPASGRVVHVRIGAIEIHGATAATAAPVPQTAPPAPSAAHQASGFDAFSRLRSYAPWEW
jgi:hypothetical protein